MSISENDINDVMNVQNKFFTEGSLDAFTINQLITLVNAHDLNNNDSVRQSMKDAYLKAEKIRIENWSISELGEVLERNSVEVNLKPINTIIFKGYIDFLVKSDSISYPKFVHENIADILMKRRCSKEKEFLSSEGRKLLNGIAQKMSMNNYLELNKKNLCQAIFDVNTVAKTKANKSLTTCFKGLNELENIDITNSSGDKLRQNKQIKAEYDKLKVDMNVLNDLLNEWDDVDFYRNYEYCSQKNNDNKCVNMWESLHEFASRILEQSEKCNKTIKKLKRQFKITNIAEDAGFLTRLKANYF